MLTTKSSKLSNTNYHFTNTNFNPNFNQNINNPNQSPKTNTNNNIFYNYNETNNESPKSNINQNIQNTFNYSSKLLQTFNNTAGFNQRKTTNLNLQTNASKNQSLNSSNSKFPLTTYISCSTLQSGVAAYSIPKTRRFQDSYKISYCDSIYSLPEFKKSGVSIGNGTRKDLFDRKGDVPSPHDYMCTSVFEQNVSKKKGFSLASKIRIKVS